jgi:hypothetical protein
MVSDRQLEKGGKPGQISPREIGERHKQNLTTASVLRPTMKVLSRKKGETMSLEIYIINIKS